MEEKYIIQLVQNLIGRFEHLGANNFSLIKELESVNHPITYKPVDEKSILEIKRRFLDRIQYQESHDNAILIPVSTVSDPRDHEEWYEEWLENHSDEQGSYYWKRLENFLSYELSSKYGSESAGKVVRSIDEATAIIMAKVANPRRNQFNYKGLVVGYVQSGKTANFTALIAKAADSGYKLIIVLAGIHNVLRRQTQIRLDRELTGVRDINGPDKYILQPGAARSWTRLTTAENDFTTANLGLFENYCQQDTPTIAVVKKNVRVLDRLIDYFSQATPESRDNMPILIIDDEADQASIDGNANDPDSDPTRTNDRIRTLLRLFNRKAYVGYTATPFANVLIDMSSDDINLEDDLYPRNFIVSLPEPEGYFGTSTVFRGDLSERFVTPIPDERNELLGRGLMTENLSTAIDEFILCCAVRNIRGDKSKPMSMLVHVSHRIADMAIIKNIISSDNAQNLGYIELIISRYNEGVGNIKLKEEYLQVWSEFINSSKSINEHLNLNNIVPDFEQIWTEISNVLKVIRVVELNSDSEDRLDYTTGEEMKIIAVGGNQLSRGLTLEGLMTSYYLRVNQSMAYDTLLQMARWFGYRKGYEDLTRIHTTELIWDYFEHLALVEQELRAQIYRYEEEGLTPLEMSVAIMAHRTLRITAPNKMGAAQTRQSSYSKSLNQTIWLPLDQPQVLNQNYILGDQFISSINISNPFNQVTGTGIHLSQNVNGETVLMAFLNKYTFVDNSLLNTPGLDDENLLGYIHRRLSDQNPELTLWNIALVGNINSKYPNDPLIYGGLPINRVGRSRKHTSIGYNIGVLTESAQLTIDLPDGANNPYDGRSPQNPLLLIYIIAKESMAVKQISEPLFNQRINLYRNIQTDHVDVLGIAIVLPESRQEPNTYIGQ